MNQENKSKCCKKCYNPSLSYKVICAECPCHTPQSLEEKDECKSCYGKGYYTQMYNTIGSEDFGGEGFETGSKIHKIPCKECNRIKSLTCDCKDCVPPTDSNWEENIKKMLSVYNAEILNKFQDEYLFERGSGCEKILFPVLEKAMKDFINPPNDGIIRKFNLKDFIQSEREKEREKTIKMLSDMKPILYHEDKNRYLENVAIYNFIDKVIKII